MRVHGNGCTGQAWVMAAREPEGRGQQEAQQAERARKKTDMPRATGEAVGAQLPRTQSQGKVWALTA